MRGIRGCSWVFSVFSGYYLVGVEYVFSGGFSGYLQWVASVVMICI